MGDIGSSREVVSPLCIGRFRRQLVDPPLDVVDFVRLRFLGFELGLDRGELVIDVRDGTLRLFNLGLRYFILLVASEFCVEGVEFNLEL